MTKAAGTVALVGGDEWTEPCTPFDRRLLELAGTDEVLVLPTAAAFEQPDRAVARADGVLRGSRRPSDRARRPESPRRRCRRQRLGRPCRPVRLPRRRFAAPPALGAEGQRVLRRDGLRLRPGRGDRRVGCGRHRARRSRWSIRAAARTRSASGSSPDWPSSRTTAGPPSISASDRSTCWPSDAVLVGVDEQTAIVRSGAGPWEVMGAGGATVYRKDAKPKTAKSGSTVELAVAALATSR